MAEIVRTTPVYIISQSGSCVYLEAPLALLLVGHVHVFFYTLHSNYEPLGIEFKGHSDKTLHFYMKKSAHCIYSCGWNGFIGITVLNFLQV